MSEYETEGTTGEGLGAPEPASKIPGVGAPLVNRRAMYGTLGLIGLITALILFYFYPTMLLVGLLASFLLLVNGLLSLRGVRDKIQSVLPWAEERRFEQIRLMVIISFFVVAVFILAYNNKEKEDFKAKLGIIEYDFYRIDAFDVILSLLTEWDITPSSRGLNDEQLKRIREEMPHNIPGKYIGPSYLVGYGTVLDYSFYFNKDKTGRVYIRIHDAEDRITELPKLKGEFIDTLANLYLEIYISYLEPFDLEGIEDVYVTLNVNKINLKSHSIPIKKFEKAPESEGNPTTIKYKLQLSEVYKDNSDIRTMYSENVKKAKLYPSLSKYSLSSSDQPWARKRSSPIFFP